MLKSLQGSMPVYQAGPELWTTKHLKRSWDHFKRKYVWFSSYLFHLCIILYSFENIPFLYSWHMTVYLCIILYSFGNILFFYSCYMIVYLDFLIVFPFIMIIFFINFSTTNKLECYFMKLFFIVNLMVVSIIQSINYKRDELKVLHTLQRQANSSSILHARIIRVKQRTRLFDYG